MKKSRILKAITLFFIVLMGLIILFIFALMSGIKLNNISYGDINVSKLYIKYDKRLIVNLKQLDFNGQKIDLNGTIDYKDKRLMCDISNLFYHNGGIDFKGFIQLKKDEIKKIKNHQKNDIKIDNIYFQYNKNIEPLLAQYAIISYKNNTLSIDLKKPRLDGIDLDGTTLKINHLTTNPTLDLDLHSTNHINDNVLRFLKFYNISIPILQKKGKNNIDLKLILPFKDPKNMSILMKGEMENCVLIFDDKKLQSKKIDIIYKDKQLKINSNNGTLKLKKIESFYDNLSIFFHNKILDLNTSLHHKNDYKVDLELKSNFENNITQIVGKIDHISLKNLLEVDNKFFHAHIKTTQDRLEIDIPKIKLQYIKEKNKHFLEVFKVEKLFNYIPFIDHNNKNNTYLRLSSKDDLKNIDIVTKDLFVDLNPKKFPKNKKDQNRSNETPIINILAKNSIINFDEKQLQSKIIKVKKSPLGFDIELKDGSISLDTQKYSYNLVDIQMDKNIVKVDGDFDDSLSNNFTIDIRSNLENNITKGIVNIKDFRFKHYITMVDQKLDFWAKHYKDSFDLKVPSLEMVYKKRAKHHNIDLAKPDIVLKSLAFGKMKETTIKKKPFISIDSKDDFKNIQIDAQNFSLDINSSLLLKDTKKSQKKTTAPNINIDAKDIDIKYDGIDLYFNTIVLKQLKEKISYMIDLNDKNQNQFFFDGDMNLTDKKTQGILSVVDFKYKDFISIEDEKIDYLIDFSSNNKIDISSKKLDLDYKKEGLKHNLHIKNMDKVYSYISNTKSKENKQSSLKLYSDNNFKNTNININNIQIDINSSKLFKENNETNQTNKKSSLPTMVIKGENTLINYDNFTLDMDSLDLRTNKKKIILNLTPYDKNGSLFFKKDKENINLIFDDVSGDFINKLMNKKKLEKGLFQVDLRGNTKRLTGDVRFQKTTLRDVRVLNNLITFIHTTPAIYNPLLALPTLLRMGQQGFDTSGYYIKKGKVKVNFDIENKLLNLPYFRTQGTMTDFKGNGKIDFKTKQQDYKVDVIFLKDYSNTIKYIPVVNYIILGDGGNFVTQVDISGTFEKQSFETHTIKDVTGGVFNVIKRTISVPFLPFMDQKKNDSNSIELEDK